MRYWSFVFYTLVWDIFVWSGFSFLIYWHGASKWWYILAFVMSFTDPADSPWRHCCDDNGEEK